MKKEEQQGCPEGAQHNFEYAGQRTETKGPQAIYVQVDVAVCTKCGEIRKT